MPRQPIRLPGTICRLGSILSRLNFDIARRYGVDAETARLGRRANRIRRCLDHAIDEFVDSLDPAPFARLLANARRNHLQPRLKPRAAVCTYLHDVAIRRNSSELVIHVGPDFSTFPEGAISTDCALNSYQSREIARNPMRLRAI